jgi:mannan endo-1,4-beta-mannosidase
MSTLVSMLLLLAAAQAAGEKPAPAPVNPRATREARALLAFLHSVEGRFTLSGQHNFIGSGSRFTEKVREVTGRAPLVWGSDFSFAYQGDEPKGFQHCGPLNLTEPGTPVAFTKLTPEEARRQLVANVIEAHRQGHVVTLMWHRCPPEAGGDACDGKAIWTWDRRPTPAEWAELTTDGTPRNAAWKKQADGVASYLKQLRDARVPVLWRPYHEMNGIWFWWCNRKGEDGFARLWRMEYDYFTKHHQLDNLLWVWNTNAPRDKKNDEAYAYEEFFPGLDVVDVLAADVYHEDWKQSHHDDLVRLARGKPIALGEVGQPPTPGLLDAQPRWAWFMPWGNLAFWGRGPERLKVLFADARVLALGDVTIGRDGRYEVTRSR